MSRIRRLLWGITSISLATSIVLMLTAAFWTPISEAAPTATEGDTVAANGGSIAITAGGFGQACTAGETLFVINGLDSPNLAPAYVTATLSNGKSLQISLTSLQGSGKNAHYLIPNSQLPTGVYVT